MKRYSAPTISKSGAMKSQRYYTLCSTTLFSKIRNVLNSKTQEHCNRAATLILQKSCFKR